MLRYLFVVSLLLLAACGGGAAPTPTLAPITPPVTAAPATAAPATAAPATAAAGPTVSASAAGYLVGPDGLTLYIFDKDSPGTSVCKDDCLVNWPVLAVAGAEAMTIGSGLNAADFATITRDDGSLQVTHFDMPLYYFIGDNNPGDITGDGVGGVWHLATPEEPEPPASAAASPAAAEGVAVNASDDGTYLIDEAGLTLYTFDKDTTPGESACKDDCLTNWPPFSVADGATAQGGDGVDGTLATITGGDGSTQVTYNGKPLYYFVGDSAPGDTSGDGVGDVWHLAQP